MPEKRLDRLDRRSFVKTSTALGTGIVLAGCAEDEDEEEEGEQAVDGEEEGEEGEEEEEDADTPSDEQRGGTFYHTSGEDADTLDPRMSTLAWTSAMGHYTFDTLLAMRPDGSEYVPHLATEMPEEIDETTYVFRLEEGVEFHNGEEVTADDVVYSLEWQLDPDNASPNREAIDFIESVERDDEYELTVNLDEPFALLTDTFASNHTFVLPQGAAEEMGTEEFGETPIGSGPFEFAEWESASHVRLEANEDYFLVEPNLDAIEYRIIPEREVQYVELATGGVHQADITETLLETARDEQGIRVEILDTFNYRGLNLNCNREPFDDVRAREAMQYLVDYEELREVTVGELGKPAVGYMPDGTNEAWDFPVDDWLADYFPERDHDRAVELLDEAGYHPDDFDKTLELSSLAGEHFKNMMIVFQSELDAIGIDANVSEVTIGEWLDQLDFADFDATIYGWWGGSDPHGYQFYLLKDPRNDPGFEEDDDFVGNSSVGYIHEAHRDDAEISDQLQRVDELVREASRTLDRDERREMYIESAETIQALYPGIQVYNDASAMGISDAVQDYEPSVWASQELANQWNNAWIDE